MSGTIIYHVTNPATLSGFVADWGTGLPEVLTSFGGSLPSFIGAFGIYVILGTLALKSRGTR